MAHRTKPTVVDFGLDGGRILEYVVENSPYGSIERAVAHLSVFSNPHTVNSLSGNLFKTIRGTPRGSTLEADSTYIMLDDNKSPTDAFIWLHGWKRGTFKDVQFNHVWSKSDSVADYTNIANLVVTPTFLAKLTDTHQGISSLLKYRAFDLYGYFPSDVSEPLRPENYQDLEWAPTLSAINDPERVLRNAMATKKNDRTIKSARELGWLFSDFHPDATL